jgi:hypothetical protein
MDSPHFLPFLAPGLCHGGGTAGWLGSLGALDLGAADPREGLVAQGRPRLGCYWVIMDYNGLLRIMDYSLV